jgi:hypothetical protein
MKLLVPTVLLAAALASSCGRRDAEPRVYTEEASPPAAMPAASTMPPGNVPMPPPAEVAWTLPEGWKANPGGGMRRATFTFEEAGATQECALTSLAGEAGGVAANVTRWGGQIGLTAPPEKRRAFVEALPERKTAAGAPMWIVDFSAMEDGRAAGAPSMIAAIVRRANDTVFLKLTAPRAVIDARRADFESLAASLR